MMNNLFMMFDPSSNLFSLNWLVMMFPMLFMIKNYYLNFNRLNFMMYNLSSFVMKDLKQILIKNNNKMVIIFMMMLTLIYMINIMSLFPFIFTPTSHLSFNLFLSLPIWFSFFLKNWMKNSSHMFLHLVPVGTPTALIPFMVLIETISNLIRPLTLSIRLTANMISGHILIALLSNLFNMNIFILFFSSLVMFLLLILELSVSIIQAYVFIILMSLYLSEMK